MHSLGRCPSTIEEFARWCENSGLNRGSLEGLKALKYWPQIIEKYSIQIHDSSMINLLHRALYGASDEKAFAFEVMTQSRELSNYCQESVRPTHSRKYAEALNNLDKEEALELLANAVIADNARKAIHDENGMDERTIHDHDPAYMQVMHSIEQGEQARLSELSKN